MMGPFRRHAPAAAPCETGFSKRCRAAAPSLRDGCGFPSRTRTAKLRHAMKRDRMIKHETFHRLSLALLLAILMAILAVRDRNSGCASSGACEVTTPR